MNSRRFGSSLSDARCRLRWYQRVKAIQILGKELFPWEYNYVCINSLCIHSHLNPENSEWFVPGFCSLRTLLIFVFLALKLSLNFNFKYELVFFLEIKQSDTDIPTTTFPIGRDQHVDFQCLPLIYLRFFYRTKWKSLCINSIFEKLLYCTFSLYSAFWNNVLGFISMPYFVYRLICTLADYPSN